jgi:PAS domain S-box-containing protein
MKGQSQNGERIELAGNDKQLGKQYLMPIVNFENEMIAQNNNVYISSVDGSGIVQYVSENYCAALGYSQEELIGTHLFNYLLETNSDGLYQWNRIDEVKQNLLDPPARDVEIRCKNGDSLWLESRTRILSPPDTNVIFTISAGIDISARRRMEKELNKIHSHLSLSVFFNNALENKHSFTEIANYATELNIRLAAPIVFLLLQPRYSFTWQQKDPSLDPEWKQWAIPAMNAIIPENNAAVWDCQEGIAILASFNAESSIDSQIESLIENILQELQKHDFAEQTTLGVSDIWHNPTNISEPFRQARESASFGSLISPDGFAQYWNKLGLIRLLLEMNSPHTEQFIKQQLGPLLRLEPYQSKDLFRTLSEILSSNSISTIANRLHVHPKTIAYRRTRLEKLLQADFDNPLTRTDLLVALRLYQIRNQPANE